MWKSLIAVTILVSFSVPASAQQVESLVVNNTNVINVETGEILPNRSIFISDGIISGIVEVSQVDIDEKDWVIDGTGLYVMPGLADMHVHVGEADLPVLLANGITTVVEMNGSPDKLAMRDKVESGELLGPRIYMTSPLLAGSQQNFAFQFVRNEEDAKELVTRSKALGYDFIKVYDGLSLESYESIVTTARDIQIPILGHIPAAVSTERVLEDGFKSIEHVEQVTRAEVGYSFDRTQIPRIVSLFESRATAVTPTLAAMEILSSRNTLWFDTLFDRAEMEFTPAEVTGWWQTFRSTPASRSELTGTEPGGNSNAVTFYRELTRALANAGVFLLAGTDTPNPLLVPGFSLHHEFEALARAGLSNQQILMMTTRNAAIHLQAETEFGSIASGVAADIILLRKNPLEDLSALRTSLEGVYTQGRWIGSERLSSFLN